MKNIFLFVSLFIVKIGTTQTTYFQQEVNTTIAVTLDDKKHLLTAFEEIEYINNSNDELTEIYMHLWPNAYKNNKTDLATQLDENGEINLHFADSIDRGFIDQLDFKVNGTDVGVKPYQEMLDVVILTLNAPLKPGEKISITTPFRVKIPKGIFSRLGHIGESYQITQWYPKPAVYDQEGWHPLPYLSQGEFFSEYGSFDVKITLPKNYVLGATGDRIDATEEESFLEAKVIETKKLIENGGPIPNKAGYPNMTFPKSSTEMKTIQFHQENVHDFAWFADKRYHVLKGEVALPNSGRKVTTWAMFTNNEFNLWVDAIEYLNDATFYYSKWTGEYPYNHVTAVDGSISAGGGMEYPNITVIGESYTKKALEQVIVHEVGHNWFYGLLGSNERYNAWMDEGLNTFTENRYTETKYPDSDMGMGLPHKILKKIGLDSWGPRGMYDVSYVFNARRNYDQPIQTRSDLFTPMNYGAIVYGKTAIGFDLLLAYLGDDVFDQCMHAYFEKWHFKHPKPEDVQSVFEQVTGENLNWLFADFIKTTKKIDYKMNSYKEVDGIIKVEIENIEKINAPFSLSVLKDGKPISKTWHAGFEGKKEIEIKTKGEEIVLDYDKDIPELNRTNNHIKTKGIFKKVEPLKLEILGSFEKEEVTSIYWSPILGWNDQDKTMLGLAFYNKSIPEKKLEWLLAPMFATGSKSAVGIADLVYNTYGQGLFRRFSIGYNFKTFNSKGKEATYFYEGQTFSEATTITYFKPWYRHQVSLNGELNRSTLRQAKHNIELRYINIDEQLSLTDRDYSNALDFNYKISSKQPLKPASLKIALSGINSLRYGSFLGASVEGKIRKNYNLDLKGIELRLFAGQSLVVNEVTGKYNWSLSGKDGNTDYLYDHTLLSRSGGYTNALYQQSTNTQGNFKVATPYAIGSNNSWVVASNLKIEIPKLPLGIYADGGIYPSKQVTINGVTDIVKFQYDYGIYIPIAKDVFEIYFPVGYSKDIANSINYNNVAYLQRIRFVLNFNKINPFKLIKDIAP